MPSSTFFHLPPPKRERLMQAAREEFSRVPYDEASINRIVRRAEISRGSFYMYFDDKEDLFRHLLRSSLEQFVGQFIRLLRQERGDLFAAILGLYDLTLEQYRQGDEEQRVYRDILRLNAGMQQGALLRSLEPERLLHPLIPEIDREKLALDREGELEEMLCILLCLTVPVLCQVAAGEQTDGLREHYCTRLDILSRGMSAGQAATI